MPSAFHQAEQFLFWPAGQTEFGFSDDLATICGTDLRKWRFWIWLLALLEWEPKPTTFTNALASLGKKGVRA